MGLTGKLGRTADLARDAGRDVVALWVLGGVRLWF